MEDAIADFPRVMKIPINMLIGDYDGVSRSFSGLTDQFFSVSDGHGSSQVQLISINKSDQFLFYSYSILESYDFVYLFSRHIILQTIDAF